VAVVIGAVVSSPESVKKGGISPVSWLLSLEVGIQAFLQTPGKDLKSYKHSSLPLSLSLFLSFLAIKNSDKYYHTPIDTRAQTMDR